MDAAFWHEKWAQGQIGFHSDQVHADLIAHDDKISGRVLVPLCGKTVDLRYLVEQGYQVVGIELSGEAVQAIAQEQGFDFRSQYHPEGICHQAAGLTVWEADFFDLTSDCLGNIDSIWERAARVALPATMRQRYAEHLVRLAPQASLLLNVLDGLPAMPNPPHGVSQTAVSMQHPTARLLDTSDVLDEHWRQRGMTKFERQLFFVPKLGVLR